MLTRGGPSGLPLEAYLRRIDLNNWMAQKLLPHVGHDISCVTYGDSEDPSDICIECDECGTVLVSAEEFESDMAGDYRITHQLRIGGRTLVLGHNPEDQETPFLICYQDFSLGFPRFTEAVGGDDYLEIVELFSQRLQQQVEAVKQQRAERNLPFAALTREHCRKREPEESLEGKLVIVKASNIAPEYRSADYQLGYALGGFGCKPRAGGRAVFFEELYSGERSRWDIGDILGIADLDKLPEWAKVKVAEHEKEGHEQ